MKEITTFKSEEYYGSTLDAHLLQRKFFNGPKFKTSRSIYEAGAEFHMSTQSAKVFVFDGEILFWNDLHRLSLRSGEWADIPRGSYSIKVGGS